VATTLNASCFVEEAASTNKERRERSTTVPVNRIIGPKSSILIATILEEIRENFSLGRHGQHVHSTGTFHVLSASMSVSMTFYLVGGSGCAAHHAHHPKVTNLEIAVPTRLICAAEKDILVSVGCAKANKNGVAGQECTLFAMRVCPS
jgi:hypothetical protein